MSFNLTSTFKDIFAGIAKAEFLSATTQDIADLALKTYSQLLGSAAAETLASQNTTFGPTALATIQGSVLAEVTVGVQALAANSTNPTVQQAAGILTVLSGLGL